VEGIVGHLERVNQGDRLLLLRRMWELWVDGILDIKLVLLGFLERIGLDSFVEDLLELGATERRNRSATSHFFSGNTPPPPSTPLSLSTTSPSGPAFRFDILPCAPLPPLPS